MHTYEKRYINDQDSYEIWQIRADGTQRCVDEDYAGFVEWIQSNVLPEVDYVAPPEPEPLPPSIESRVQAVEDALLMII